MAGNGQLSTLQGDYYIAGNVSAQSMTIPAGTIKNADVLANAGIDYTKLEHKHPIRYSQKAGTAIVSETHIVHIAPAPGEVLTIRVACITPPTTTDTVEVDLKLGNAATPFASILTAPIELDSASVTRTVYSAVPSSPDYVAGDQLEIVVTVTGSSAQGLAVNVEVSEAAQ